jgi:hypothetical protein
VPDVSGSNQITTTINNVPMVIIPRYSGPMTLPVLPSAKPTGGSSGVFPSPNSDGDPASYHFIIRQSGNDFEYEGWDTYYNDASEHNWYNLCDISPAWTRDAPPLDTTSDPELPSSLNGIAVYGDTCSLTKREKGWRLTCNKWKEPTCATMANAHGCDNGFAWDRLACRWDS